MQCEILAQLMQSTILWRLVFMLGLIFGLVFGYILTLLVRSILKFQDRKKQWLDSLDDKSYRRYKQLFEDDKYGR